MKFKGNLIAIVLVAMLAIVCVVIWGVSFFRYTSPGAVIRYIQGFRQNVAIACLDPEHPETGFYYQDEEAYPLASTSQLVLLAAYAQEVAAGRLNPEEEIPFSAVEPYYLPYTDAGAHPAFLQSLGEGRTSMTLSEAVNGMIIYSSNANADYLLNRLKDVSFPELYQRLGLKNTSEPFSFLQLYLFMANHETGQYAQDDLTPEELKAEQLRLANLYMNDPAWREAEIKFAGNETTRPNFIIQQEATSIIGMKGSARDFTTLMLAAYGYNNALTKEEQAVMQKHLEWANQLNPDNEKTFKVLATKGGSWPGVFTTVWYAETLDGKKTALAVFYKRVPEDFWNTWIVSFSQQELETQVLTNGTCSTYADTLK